ncbi:hypothetical protein ID866_7668 [Astraeus odoratus]|nr:hypothetical protein ID866_7668 [Astraeus odoratus]
MLTTRTTNLTVVAALGVGIMFILA